MAGSVPSARPAGWDTSAPGLDPRYDVACRNGLTLCDEDLHQRAGDVRLVDHAGLVALDLDETLAQRDRIADLLQPDVLRSPLPSSPTRTASPYRPSMLSPLGLKLLQPFRNGCDDGLGAREER